MKVRNAAVVKLFLCLILLAAYSCVDKKAKNLEIMTERFRTYSVDYINKLNEEYESTVELEIIELTPVDYKMVTINHIDSLRLYEIEKEVEYYARSLEFLETSLEMDTTLLMFQKDIEPNRDFSTEIKEIEKKIAEFNQYNDSIDLAVEEDSLIRERIFYRSYPPKDYYQTKFFCKAVIKEDQDHENIIDTLTVYFDPELNVVEFNELIF